MLVMRLFACSLAAVTMLLSGTLGSTRGAAAQVVGNVSVNLELVAQGFTSAIELVPVPDGTGRLFVVDQIGLVHILLSDGTLLPEPFLDVRSKMVTLNANYDERGLLGLAFHPQYAQNGRFFVYYSAPRRPEAPQDWNHTGRIAEYKVSSDPNKADPNSERVVMFIDQPQSNHNGGTILFGPNDGYLYISLGDGGAAHDRGIGHPDKGNGQDITTILGNILRIDVDHGDPYGIPPDNPFVGKEGLDEIYAYGFRNPYRMSFDQGFLRELFVADVGQNLFEEVNIVRKGGNYGWRLKEGTHCFDPDNPNNPPETCSPFGYFGEPLLGPIIEYGHPSIGGPGVAIAGGHVYRGKALPMLYGQYVFGDWSKSFSSGDGSLFVAMRRGVLRTVLWPIQEIAISNFPNQRIGQFVMSVGQDLSGEMYVLTKETLGPSGSTGKVYKIVPSN